MKKKNKTQRANLASAFRAMAPKKPHKSKGGDLPFRFIPTEDPKPIGVMRSTDGEGRMAIKPVCRWRGRHVNTRHNRDYIPPRRLRQKMGGAA